MGGAWPRVERSRDGSLLADKRVKLEQIQGESVGVVSQECRRSGSWMFVIVHRSFPGGDQKSGVGAGGSGSIGAWSRRS